MAYEQMPPDTNEAPKIVGNILTLGELVWIAGFTGVGVGLSVLLYSFVKYPAFILTAIFAIPGIMFAKLKIKGLPLFTYLVRSYRLKHSVTKHPKESPREEVEFVASSERR